MNIYSEGQVWRILLIVRMVENLSLVVPVLSASVSLGMLEGTVKQVIAINKQVFIGTTKTCQGFDSRYSYHFLVKH